jgi:hypothetical protein
LKDWKKTKFAQKTMRAEKILGSKVVEASELLNLVPVSQLESLAEALQSDKWVPKLKSATMFQLLLLSVLEQDRLSLRLMEETYNSPSFQLRIHSSGSGASNTAHSSLCDRLKTIKLDYFKSVYEKVYEQVSRQYSNSQLKHYNLKRYDSTMIRVFSHLMEGMRVGNTSKNKHQVKFTTEFTNDFEIRMRFFKDQDHLGEEVALKEVIQSQSHATSDLVVFDRGLKSRETMCELNAGPQKTQFVTRLHDKNRYKWIREHTPIHIQDPKNPFLQDSIVNLYGDGNRLVREEFRMIELVNRKTGKKVFFLTNIMDLPTAIIAEIYRQRWQIEVLFRFMKQEMNLSHFVCHDPNAIQVMMYVTLIAAMLVLIFKKKNGLSSFKIAKKRFSKEIEAALILEILQTPEGVEIYKTFLKNQVENQYDTKQSLRKRKRTNATAASRPAP